VVLVPAQPGCEVSGRGVADAARIEVAEGNEPVWIALADRQDFLIRLQEIDFRADQGHQDAALDLVGVIDAQDLFRIGKLGATVLGRPRIRIRMYMHVDEHGHFLSRMSLNQRLATVVSQSGRWIGQRPLFILA